MTFTINDNNHTNILKLNSGPNQNTLIIPPRCETIRKFHINTNEEVLVDHLEITPGVYTARTVINPNYPFIRVINTTDTVQVIPSHISKFEPLSNFHIYQTNTCNKDNIRTNKLKNILNKNIPHQYKDTLFPLIEEYNDIFALPDDPMSINNFYTQKLRIKENTSTYIKNYRTPHVKKQEIEKQINTLINNNLIEPSESSYNSPIILVPKKSTNSTQKWRMCIDYRKVNQNLIPDRFPLPRIDDILDNLGRTIFFSVLDLYNGFKRNNSIQFKTRFVPMESSSLRTKCQSKQLFKNDEFGIYRAIKR